MYDEIGITNNVIEDSENTKKSQEIDSDFRLVVIAALRSKQLQKGAHPLIDKDSARRRNTNIAIEETRQGLIHFKLTNEHK